MAISVGSIVCATMSCKVIYKNEDGEIINGKWTVVSKGDVGRVISLLNISHHKYRVSYRVRFKNGVVDVNRQFLKHVSASEERLLDRAIMDRINPDFKLSVPVVSNEVEY